MILRYSIGDASFAECVDFNPEYPARLHFIPRGGSGGQQQSGLSLGGGREGIVLCFYITD